MGWGQHVPLLPAGGGNTALLGLCSLQRCLSQLPGVCHQAGTQHFTGPLPEDQGELCQQAEILLVLPRRLGIS